MERKGQSFFRKEQNKMDPHADVVSNDPFWSHKVTPPFDNCSSVSLKPKYPTIKPHSKRKKKYVYWNLIIEEVVETFNHGAFQFAPLSFSRQPPTIQNLRTWLRSSSSFLFSSLFHIPLQLSWALCKKVNNQKNQEKRRIYLYIVLLFVYLFIYLFIFIFCFFSFFFGYY